jgi:hypothetical protein
MSIAVSFRPAVDGRMAAVVLLMKMPLAKISRHSAPMPTDQVEQRWSRQWGRTKSPKGCGPKAAEADCARARDRPIARPPTGKAPRSPRTANRTANPKFASLWGNAILEQRIWRISDSRPQTHRTRPFDTGPVNRNARAKCVNPKLPRRQAGGRRAKNSTETFCKKFKMSQGAVWSCPYAATCGSGRLLPRADGPGAFPGCYGRGS